MSLQTKIKLLATFLLLLPVCVQAQQPEILDAAKIKYLKVEYKAIFDNNFEPSLFDKTKIKTNQFNQAFFTNNSFINQILYSIGKQGVTAYSAYSNSFGKEFTEEIAPNEILEILGTKKFEYKENDIVGFIFKEFVFYDKNDNIICKKITGICPLKQIQTPDGKHCIKTFWVYYPDIQKNLEKTKIKGLKTNFAKIIDDNLPVFTYLDDRNIYQPDNKDIANDFSNIFQNFFKIKEPEKDIVNIDFSDVKNSKVTYAKIDENDIYYGKYVYFRVLKNGARDTNYYKKDDIDSVNNPLFFDSHKYSTNYFNLIDIILSAIHTGGLTAYRASPLDIGEEYNEIITENEIWSELGAHSDVICVKTLTDDIDTVTVDVPYDTDEITSFLIQELWLYDKNNNVIQKKVIGICPIRQYYRPDDFKKTSPLYKKTFWIYYPEFQGIASKEYMYPSESSGSLTFDDFIANNKFYGLNLGDSAVYSSLASNYFNYYKDLYVNIEALNNSGDIAYKDITKNIVFHEKQDVFYPEKVKKYKYAQIEIERVKASDNDNLPLFLPYSPARGFKSMIDVILYEVLNRGGKAYNNENLEKQLTTKEIRESLGEHIEIAVIEMLDGKIDTLKVFVPYNSAEITSYLFKEICFYDKNNNLVDKRILAVCPIREYYRDDDIDMTKPLYKKTFWIEYSAYQKALEKHNLTKIAPIDIVEFKPDINYTVFEAKPNMTINEFLIKNKYQTESIDKQKISKRKAKKILKEYGY